MPTGIKLRSTWRLACPNVSNRLVLLAIRCLEEAEARRVPGERATMCAFVACPGCQGAHVQVESLGRGLKLDDSVPTGIIVRDRVESSKFATESINSAMVIHGLGRLFFEISRPTLF